MSRTPAVFGGPRLAGFTVVSPHKERAVELANEVGDWALRSSAANVMLRTARGWRAETTDAHGVLEPLRRRDLTLAGRTAMVIGCGGAGRAAAAALSDCGVEVTLTNRGAERGEFAARLLGLPWVPLCKLDVQGLDLLVNATPLGQNDDRPPFDVAALPRHAIVIDYVYSKLRSTPLAESTRAAGLELVDGREILIIQVAAQFERMTGKVLDEDLAWKLTGWTKPRPIPRES